MFLKNNYPGILWGGLIILLTTLPGSAFPKLPSYVDMLQPDKLVHLFIFLVLVILLVSGFRKEGTPPLIRHNSFTVALTLAVSIGGFTEIMQGLVVPMRFASPYDFLANVAGSILGAFLFMVYEKRKRKAKKYH